MEIGILTTQNGVFFMQGDEVTIHIAGGNLRFKHGALFNTVPPHTGVLWPWVSPVNQHSTRRS